LGCGYSWLRRSCFFGGLFTAYIIFRNLYLPAFEAGSRLLDVRIGSLQYSSIAVQAA